MTRVHFLYGTTWTCLGTASRAATAVGALTLTIKPTGGLTSYDGTSSPCNSTVTITSGSWGDAVCDLNVVGYSHTALFVSFRPPVTAFNWVPQGRQARTCGKGFAP